MTTSGPLPTQDIERRLEQWLEVEFTFYRVDALAAGIARHPRAEQDFLLDWTRRIATTNLEIAWQFARRAGELLERMDRRLIEAWALHAMDTYDREGLRPALLVIERVNDFAHLRHAHAEGALFEELDGILLTFVRGLSGRRLKLQQGDAVWTDSETLYLPPVIADMPTAADNFALAKTMVAFLWAQTRFGSFRADPRERMAAAPDPGRALRAFGALEALRLEACLARELPGLHREMQRLKRLLGQDRLPESWERCAEALAAPGATVEDSLRLLAEIGDATELPEFCYQGERRPEAVAACLAARIEREKMLLRVKLAKLAEESRNEAAEAIPNEAPRFDLEQDEQQADRLTEFELTLDGAPVAPPDDVRALLTSIRLDLGAIPDDYLVAAGPGEYDPDLYEEKAKNPDEVWQGTYHEEGATLYPEWDFGRQNYRKNWCVMREKDVTPAHDGFIAETLGKHQAAVKSLRRTFEAMRDENRLFKRQPYGDEVDLDALVEAIADARDGREMTDRLYTRLHRAERDIAVVFMVDMSGSTKGWINDAERESLVLLCEALEALGDRYAIYGFSGITRKRCELYRIKRLDEPYDDEVRARISGIRPRDYTRMGFAIRHLARLLYETEARTKLLVTISDGRPEDYHDGYRGKYGVEDTRQALIEARRNGIHPFCITIDKEAREYLPHMYGAAHYVVIDDVRSLPLKVPNIYRALTAQ
jgi:nitric oxide reductase NorD protein